MNRVGLRFRCHALPTLALSRPSRFPFSTIYITIKLNIKFLKFFAFLHYSAVLSFDHFFCMTFIFPTASFACLYILLKNESFMNFFSFSAIRYDSTFLFHFLESFNDQYELSCQTFISANIIKMILRREW